MKSLDRKLNVNLLLFSKKKVIPKIKIILTFSKIENIPKEAGEDFFNWKPKAINEKRQQTNSKNISPAEEPNVSKKFKSNSLEKIEFVPFRTNLDWFMTPGIYLSNQSINSESILKKLWLKEVEALF